MLSEHPVTNVRINTPEKIFCYNINLLTHMEFVIIVHLSSHMHHCQLLCLYHHPVYSYTIIPIIETLKLLLTQCRKFSFSYIVHDKLMLITIDTHIYTVQ